MDYDESSDILGGRLHVSPQSISIWSDPAQITLLLGLGLGALYSWVRLAPHFRQWRETRYRKAMRRRHGIPDDDNRPFNVAYAAALQARKGGERRRGHPMHGEAVTIPYGDIEESPMGATSSVLQGSGVPSGYSNIYPILDGVNQSFVNSRTAASLTGQAAFQQDRTPQTAPRSLPIHASGRNPRPSGVAQPMITRSLHGKHALDDGVDSEPETQSKKTRVEGEDLIDGDEEAGWHGSNEEMDVDEVQPAKRGFKRVASVEDDEGLASSRAYRLGKRARKVSIDRSPQSPEEDMVDEEDEEDDADIAVRGKKRDRTEAGSTFGGDDSLMDDDEKPRRRRKRTVSNKFGQSSSRGQKRGRDLQSYDSDNSDAEIPKRKSTRKKRGRRSQDEFAPLSTDSSCKGRRIGEEWESNGIRYKVGPNGQRLRQALVKKSRSLFAMPSDSQHPDRRAHLDVYVETWLSEEEYAAAKERHELAWQDAPTVSSEPQTPGDVPDSPSKSGKSLLWSSTMSCRESPVKRGPLRQSIATNLGLRLNVFPPPQVASNRRISTVYQTPASPATDSPKLQKSKSYSKWEKQDLEAAAMSKIRDRQAARAAEASKTSPLAAPPSTSTPSLFSTPSTGIAQPTALNKPAAIAAPSATSTSKASSSQAAKPSAPSASSTTAPSAEPSKSTFLFGASTSAIGSNTPSAPTPATSTPQSSSAAPNFFSKQLTQTPAPSASTPNFFGKPAQAGSSTAPNAASKSGATQPQSSEAFNPAFAFAAPPTQQTGPSSSIAPFGAAIDATKTEQAKAPTPGASLLSRIGMGPPPSQSVAAPTFSFTKTESAASSTPSTDAAKTTASAPASSTPKFSFGVTSQPSSTASTSAPTAPAGATATTTAPKFSFGVNTGTSQTAASSTPSPFGNIGNKDTGASYNKPSASVSNPFGGASTTATSTTPAATAPSPFGSTTNGSSKPAETPKPGLFGNTSTATPSSFGGASAATSSHFGASAMTSSPFGATPAAASGFGTTSAMSAPSPFGVAASTATMKPAEAPKSAFSFGGNTSSSSSSAPSSFGGNGQNAAGKTETEAAKPSFSFGTSSSTPTFGSTTTPVATSAFGVSAKPTTAPTFGASSTPAFGATSTAGNATSGNKTAFSFGFGGSSTPSGASTTTSTTENKPASTFGFGATTGNNTTTTSAAPSGSAFGFGAQPANNASATSPFGATSTGQQGSSPFSFGAPSGTFSFGSNAQK